MPLKRVAAVLVPALVLALMPASAAAQTLPSADDYFGAVSITGLTSPGILALQGTASNSGFGTQGDIPHSGGGGTLSDPNSCGVTGGGSLTYDSTAWYEFHAPWNGLVDVTVQSSEFRPVASMFPYNAANSQIFTTDLGGGSFAIRGSHCEVASELNGQLSFRYDPGFAGSHPQDDPVFGGGFVRAGSDYKIQIGGTPTGGTGGLFALVFRFEWDRDADGIYESAEDPRCITVPGKPGANQGCPNADNDPFKDLDDDCDSVPGSEFRGCPDADGDRVPEKAAGLPGRDVCAGENASARDANGNGCLDWRHMRARFSRSYSVRFNPAGRRIGVTLTKLEVLRAPNGARVSISCKKGKRRVCRFRPKTAGRSGKVVFIKERRSRSHKDFPPGTKISARVTKPSGLFIGRFLTLVTTTRKVQEARELCVPPRGSQKPKRCSQVSTDR